MALAECPHVDVNWQDNEGNTALIMAAQAGKSCRPLGAQPVAKAGKALLWTWTVQETLSLCQWHLGYKAGRSPVSGTPSGNHQELLSGSWWGAARLHEIPESCKPVPRDVWGPIVGISRGQPHIARAKGRVVP